MAKLKAEFLTKHFLVNHEASGKSIKDFLTNRSQGSICFDRLFRCFQTLSYSFDMFE